jgi:IPT/TIG domain
MGSERSRHLVAFLLVVYLLVVGLGAGWQLIGNFQGPPPPAGQAQPGSSVNFPLFVTIGTPEQRLLLVAFLAGVVGSFLHAAQSLTSYIGNDTFKPSWAAWYLMRPWIGGILGLAIYFVSRAGFVGTSTTDVNTYGMVAVGLLGGWFSKTATDKLQEVFETLFKTDADKERRDKLTKDEQPAVTRVEPSPVPQDATELTITGSGFASGVTVTLNGTPVMTTFVSQSQLRVNLTGVAPRPTGDVLLLVKNTGGTKPASAPSRVPFLPAA